MKMISMSKSINKLRVVKNTWHHEHVIINFFMLADLLIPRDPCLFKLQKHLIFAYFKSPFIYKNDLGNLTNKE